MKPPRGDSQSSSGIWYGCFRGTSTLRQRTRGRPPADSEHDGGITFSIWPGKCWDMDAVVGRLYHGALQGPNPAVDKMPNH